MLHISVKLMAALVLCTCSVYAQDAPVVNESGQSIGETPLSDLVKKSILVSKPTLVYEPLREADIAWEKHLWREIDTREKLNLPFRYPGAPLIVLLSESILSGEVMAYSNDDFTGQLRTDEVERMLIEIDTVRILDPVTQTERMEVARSELNPADIVKYRIREIWYFDKKTSRMRSRIMAIAPVREYYDDGTGEFKYEAPLFWLHFPSVREELARHRVYTTGNDASLLSWSDVFEMRMFSSFVYKESNVLDMRLVDYYPKDGIARLMEGDKIESELFNWEHDLWSY